uniref:TNFR-Cys domain-containing protein n=1 Tax=Strongyloides stercoralis TaxID=6248 RepID=A0A0K0E6W5_STRER
MDLRRSHEYGSNREYSSQRERSHSLVDRLHGIVGPTLRTDEEIEEYDEDGKHVVRTVETVEKLVYLPAANNTISRENINYSSIHERRFANEEKQNYGRHHGTYNDSFRRRSGSYDGGYNQTSKKHNGGIDDESLDYGFKKKEIQSKNLPTYEEYLRSKKKTSIFEEENKISYEKTRREELRDKCYTLCTSCWCIILWIICLLLLLLTIFLLLWFLVFNKSSSSISTTTIVPPGVPIINVTTNDIPIPDDSGIISYTGVQKDVLQEEFIYVFDSILSSIIVLNYDTLLKLASISTNFNTINSVGCSDCKVYYLTKNCIIQGKCSDNDAIYCCNKCKPGKNSNVQDYTNNCNIQTIQTRAWRYRNIQFSGNSGSYIMSLVSIDPDYRQDSGGSKLSANMFYHTFSGGSGNVVDSGINSNKTYLTSNGTVFETLTVAPSKIGSQDFVWSSSINSSSLLLKYFDDLLVNVPVSQVSTNKLIQLTNLNPVNSNTLQLTYIDKTNNKFLIRRYQKTKLILSMNEDFYQMTTPNGYYRYIDYTCDTNGNIYQLSSNISNSYNVRIFKIN